MFFFEETKSGVKSIRESQLQERMVESELLEATDTAVATDGWLRSSRPTTPQ